jgi:hypothetical protein
MLEQIEILQKYSRQLDLSLFYSIRISETQVWFQGNLTSSTYRALKEQGFEFRLSEDHPFLESMIQDEKGKVFITLTPPL